MFINFELFCGRFQELLWRQKYSDDEQDMMSSRCILKAYMLLSLVLGCLLINLITQTKGKHKEKIKLESVESLLRSRWCFLLKHIRNT